MGTNMLECVHPVGFFFDVIIILRDDSGRNSYSSVISFWKKLYIIFQFGRYVASVLNFRIFIFSLVVFRIQFQGLSKEVHFFDSSKTKSYIIKIDERSFSQMFLFCLQNIVAL